MENEQSESKCSNCLYFHRNLSLGRHFASMGKHHNAIRGKLDERAERSFAGFVMRKENVINGFSRTCNFAIIGEALCASGIGRITAQLVVTDCEHHKPVEGRGR